MAEHVLQFHANRPRGRLEKIGLFLRRGRLRVGIDVSEGVGRWRLGLPEVRRRMRRRKPEAGVKLALEITDLFTGIGRRRSFGCTSRRSTPSRRTTPSVGS